MRKKKATHQPLPSSSYTRASAVRITKQDPTLQELRDGSWQRWEEPLTKEEQAKVLAEDWQVILPGGENGARVIRTDRKPTSWGMSATGKEREAAHRRRIEELFRARETAVADPGHRGDATSTGAGFSGRTLGLNGTDSSDRRKAREPII
jgi:hypothetical protein